jgi:hypothetical protein
MERSQGYARVKVLLARPALSLQEGWVDTDNLSAEKLIERAPVIGELAELAFGTIVVTVLAGLILSPFAGLIYFLWAVGSFLRSMLLDGKPAAAALALPNSDLSFFDRELDNSP